MDHLYLFTKHLDQEGCFCLKLDNDGALCLSPAQRTFAEIRDLQKNCETLVIETSANASLLNLELPWLSNSKARVAIPFALEDKLAQPVQELHFAFDKERYKNNCYLITIIDNQRMHYIMHVLAQNYIEFTTITLDWFALKDEELCVNESTLLIHTKDFKGALSGELAEIYIKNHPEQHPLLFTDNQIIHASNTLNSQEDSYTWIAKRLSQAKVMNLCQGKMQTGNKSGWIKKGYESAGILFCLWLFSLIAVNAINLYFLNKQTATIDAQIATIYHEFFPDAKQVISPRFRIDQLLKGNASGDKDRFWFLLNQFSKAIAPSKFTLNELHYQNKKLLINLTTVDFTHLENLEFQLKKLHLNVKQTQASTHEQEVLATLELQ